MSEATPNLIEMAARMRVHAKGWRDMASVEDLPHLDHAKARWLKMAEQLEADASEIERLSTQPAR